MNDLRKKSMFDDKIITAVQKLTSPEDFNSFM